MVSQLLPAGQKMMKEDGVEEEEELGEIRFETRLFNLAVYV